MDLYAYILSQVYVSFVSAYKHVSKGVYECKHVCKCCHICARETVFLRIYKYSKHRHSPHTDGSPKCASRRYLAPARPQCHIFTSSKHTFPPHPFHFHFPSLCLPPHPQSPRSLTTRSVYKRQGIPLPLFFSPRIPLPDG